MEPISVEFLDTIARSSENPPGLLGLKIWFRNNHVGAGCLRYGEALCPRKRILTLQMMAGWDLTTVKELMGHKSIEMTERYSHLSPTHKTTAVKSLDSLFRDVAAPSQQPMRGI